MITQLPTKELMCALYASHKCVLARKDRQYGVRMRVLPGTDTFEITATNGHWLARWRSDTTTECAGGDTAVYLGAEHVGGALRVLRAGALGGLATVDFDSPAIGTSDSRYALVATEADSASDTCDAIITSIARQHPQAFSHVSFATQYLSEVAAVFKFCAKALGGKYPCVAVMPTGDELSPVFFASLSVPGLTIVLMPSNQEAPEVYRGAGTNAARTEEP